MPFSDMTLNEQLPDEKIAMTVRGFRLSFQVRSSECAKEPLEVSKAALGQSLGSKFVH